MYTHSSTIKLNIMKWIPLFLVSATLLASCNTGKNQGEETEASDIPMEQLGKHPVGQTIIPGAVSSGAVLEVSKDNDDRGKEIEGEKVEPEISFTHTGSHPVTIPTATAECDRN